MAAAPTPQKLYAKDSARRLTRSARPEYFENLEARESAKHHAPQATHRFAQSCDRVRGKGRVPSRTTASLARTDIINLLDVVDGTESPIFTNRRSREEFYSTTPNPAATLTTSQLTDLRTLVHDASDWHLSASVKNLLDKTVNQNPANENFQGAHHLLPAGQITTLAPRTRCCRIWSANGSTAPTCRRTANNGLPDNVIYETAQGVLFGSGGPKATDIAQGWLGDCYFLSSLGEVAKQSPKTIQSMFTNNHDGTYTVRFYEYNVAKNVWQADYVTVNLELPVFQQSGQLVYAGWYQGGQPTTYTDTSAVLWPALAEKAYAQLAEEGWSRSTNPGGSGIDGTPSDWNANCYDALNCGDGLALQQINGSNRTYDVGLAGASRSDETALEQAFAHGSMVIIGSLVQEPSTIPTNAAGVPLIIATHVYALTAVDASRGLFTLTNPLDDSGPYSGDGQRSVTLTWSQLQMYLNDYFVVAHATEHGPRGYLMTKCRSWRPPKIAFKDDQAEKVPPESDDGSGHGGLPLPA